MYEAKRRPRRLGANPTEPMPVDKYGVPLPIVDDMRVKDIYKNNPKRVERNQHHSWFDADRPEIRLSLAGQALRASRVEFLREVAHNRAHELFAQPDMQSLQDDQSSDFYGEWQMRRIILSAAGYQPLHGIDVFGSNKGHPKLIELKKLRNNHRLGHLGFEDSRFKRRELLEARLPLGEFTLQFLMNFIDDEVYDHVFEPARSGKKQKQLRRVGRVATDAIHEAASTARPLVHKAMRDGKIERYKGASSRDVTVGAIVRILNHTYPIGHTKQGSYREVGYRQELLELIHQKADMEKSVEYKEQL